MFQHCIMMQHSWPQWSICTAFSVGCELKFMQLYMDNYYYNINHLVRSVSAVVPVALVIYAHTQHDYLPSASLEPLHLPFLHPGERLAHHICLSNGYKNTVQHQNNAANYTKIVTSCNTMEKDMHWPYMNSKQATHVPRLL